MNCDSKVDCVITHSGAHCAVQAAHNKGSDVPLRPRRHRVFLIALIFTPAREVLEQEVHRVQHTTVGLGLRSALPALRRWGRVLWRLQGLTAALFSEVEVPAETRQCNLKTKAILLCREEHSATGTFVQPDVGVTKLCKEVPKEDLHGVAH